MRLAVGFNPVMFTHLEIQMAWSMRPDRVALTGFSPVKAPTPPDVRFSASGG